MAKTSYSFPVESVTGKLSSDRSGDKVTVHRRKCFGKTKDGGPIYGPNETYTYHLKQQWGEKIKGHRELFREAQQQAKAEMQDAERLAIWQERFEHQLNSEKEGEKRYVKLQCYIAAQLLKQWKGNGGSKLV